MTPSLRFAAWGAVTALLALAWYHDPWSPLPSSLLQGALGEPVSIEVRQDRRFVELRRSGGAWYVAAYSRRSDEADDPYRLLEDGPDADRTPGFDDLAWHKDRRLRRVSVLNALARDLLLFLAVLPVERSLDAALLEPAAAGFEAGGMVVRLRMGPGERPLTVVVGSPSPTGLGYYVLVGELGRAAILSPVPVEAARRILARRFDGPGQGEPDGSTATMTTGGGAGP